MTDRIKGYVVILEENIREDDAKQITDALSMVKGVLKATPLISGIEDLIAEERVRARLRNQILDILWDRKS